MIIYWIPIAAIFALGIIYRNDLGIGTAMTYIVICIALFLLLPALGFNPYVDIAAQGILAAAMFIHVKAKTV